jgi:hypothetical protein
VGVCLWDDDDDDDAHYVCGEVYIVILILPTVTADVLSRPELITYRNLI